MMDAHKNTVDPSGTTPEGATNLYALIISGDGLITSVAPALADRLAARGIGSATIKAISYFWRLRSPKAMARDLECQLRLRHSQYPGDRFLLIGYSFGAGTLPFAVNRLGDEWKNRIQAVVLLAPPDKADFRFYFRSWLNKSTQNAMPTAPEIKRLSEGTPVLYVRGEDDFTGPSDVLMPSQNLNMINLPGGHDFGKEYDVVTELILELCDKSGC